MRRACLAAALVLAAAAAAFLAWRWWTAPPRAPAERLAQACAFAAPDADGTLALARPARAARWLAPHPQALALLALAAPSVARALPRLRGVLAALAREARGPLTVWWQADGVAAGAAVTPAAARALRRLAALQGLPVRSRAADGTVVVRVGTSASLLGEGGTPPALDRAPAAVTALARVGRRLWWARAGRTSLELASGVPPPLPDESAREDKIATGDLAALLAPAASAAWIPRAPARLVLAEGGWAAALPDTTLPPLAARLLGAGGDASPGGADGVQSWRGVLGELWARPGPGVAVASRPDLLALLPAGAPPGEEGAAHGARLAALCRRVAAAFEAVPGGRGPAGDLRRAAPFLDGLRLVRWRVLPGAGHLLLEW